MEQSNNINARYRRQKFSETDTEKKR